MATKNNFTRLKEEADIESIVEYLGIPVTPRGTAKFILCPNPEHQDTRASNCYFKSGWNNVYCKACNRAMQAIDLIMYVQHCSYGEAADTLWEIEGSSDWYYADQQKEEKKKFDISAEDAKILHLHLPGRMSVPVAYQPEKAPKGYEASKKEENVWYKASFHRWEEFLSESNFKQIVRKAAARRIKLLDKMRPAYLEAVKAQYYALEQEYPDYDKTELLEVAIRYEGFPEEEYTKLWKLYKRASA